MCGRALSWRMSGPATSSWVLVHFPGKFLHESTKIHSSETSSTLGSICHDDFLVIISKDKYLLHLWLSSSNFFGRGEPVALHSLDYDFISGSKSLIHVWSKTTIRRKNVWSSTSNLFFSEFAMCRRFSFCSAVKQWGPHCAEIFLSFKSLFKIRNTDVDGTPGALESSSHVAWLYSSRAFVTIFTLLSSVDVLGLPRLVSLSMLT